MSKSFHDWLTEGESIYNDALQEYRLLEQQIQDLESRLMAKRTEVNQIAQMIGKPAVDSPARLSAEIIDREMPASMPIGSVTRALTGRGAIAR